MSIHVVEIMSQGKLGGGEVTWAKREPRYLLNLERIYTLTSSGNATFFLSGFPLSVVLSLLCFNLVVCLYLFSEGPA